jgi:hypothetical protein
MIATASVSFLPNLPLPKKIDPEGLVFGGCLLLLIVLAIVNYPTL